MDVGRTLCVHVVALLLCIVMLRDRRLRWVSVAVLVLATLVKLPVCQPDFNRELTNPWIVGTWTTVYKTEDDGRVLKQLSAPGTTFTSFDHALLPTPFRKCVHGKGCTYPTLVAHNTVIHYMWKSLKRLRFLAEETPFLAKIYEMDDRRKRYTQEYVPYVLCPEVCPADIKEQLGQLNATLKKYDYFLDDVHSGNIGVTEDGRIKIFDCEVYTSSEMRIQKPLMDFFDKTRVNSAARYRCASNIILWGDGRDGAEQTCQL